MPATLRLRPREDKRLRGGHLWIYSNEVDTRATPLKGFDTGDEVIVEAADGSAIGRAHVNPRALICARLISRDAAVGLDDNLLRTRLERALTLRERVYPEHHSYRLVYGEGDGLSGLVVDRYGPLLSVQLNSAGMERQREAIVAALLEVTGAETVVLKNDGSAREVEGLERYVEVVGEDPGEFASLTENGTAFVAPVRDGQKTGWFYDHRENRARLAPWCAGARILDAFSYVGGWGLQAMAFGGASLLALDGSARALDVLQENARRQGVGDRVETQRADAFDALEALAASGERFDVVVIDPPALIKRRKDLKAGQRGYQRLANAGMRLVADGGLLAFGSCSLHLDRAMLLDVLRSAARRSERAAQVLSVDGAGPDHPRHPAIPEGDYLKAAIVRVHAASRGGVL